MGEPASAASSVEGRGKVGGRFRVKVRLLLWCAVFGFMTGFVLHGASKVIKAVDNFGDKGDNSRFTVDRR